MSSASPIDRSSRSPTREGAFAITGSQRGGGRLPLHLHMPVGTAAPRAPLIGRVAEVATVRDQLLDPAVRLVTLTGPGGVGKTRLAMAASGEMADVFPDGVWFVPLATVSTPDRVVPAIAQVLGMREAADEPLIDRLIAVARHRRLLLVLDNFEQVVAAAPVVGRLLAACPTLSILITSRVRVRVYGEREFNVPPLPLTSQAQRRGADSAGGSAAVQLFVERARAANPRFTLTSQSAPVVAEICRRLEGLPLAIELGAARINALSPEALLARLERRLPELAGDSADLPARQRTMRDAIAWSYELLSPAERALFRRLAVFIGGFTLEAAEAVIGGAELDPFEGITALADSSLLRLQLGPHGEPRFGMLETVREYAHEQLEASEDAAQIRDRHAAAQVALAERAEPHLIGPDRRHWQTVLSLDHDNIRAALTWLTLRGDAGSLARLAGAMWRFWYAHGDHSEGRAWLRAALAAGDSLPDQSRIKVLTGAALLEHCGGNDQPANARGEEALALARQHGDDGAMAVTLYVLGKIAADGGHYERADDRFGEALTVFRARDDRIWTGLTLGQLGCAAYGRNDLAPARALLEEALTLQRASNHRYGAAVSLLYLGHLAQHSGEVAAAAHYGESLALWWEEGFQPGLVEALSGVATVAVARAQSTRAAKLFGAAAALREAIGNAGLAAGAHALRRGRSPAAGDAQRECLRGRVVRGACAAAAGRGHRGAGRSGAVSEN